MQSRLRPYNSVRNQLMHESKTCSIGHDLTCVAEGLILFTFMRADVLRRSAAPVEPPLNSLNTFVQIIWGGRCLQLQIRCVGEFHQRCWNESPIQAGHALLHVDLEGNTQVLWPQAQNLEIYGVPSPDGRHLAILGWTLNSNLWIIESL